ncbi:MAG: ABC transporter substrate-binding protein [Actinomycetota bacterium]
MSTRFDASPTADRRAPAHRVATRTIAVTVILVLAALVAPSTVTAAQGASAEERAPLVRIAIRADEANLNPFLQPNDVTVTHDLLMLVYDTLFWTQSQVAPDEWLATGAVPSPDYRTWTVSLRSGVQWHDGEPFTADDVAFTYQYFRDVGGSGRYGHHLYQHPRLETASVVDDLTVELTFTNPITTFPQLPGGDVPILPEHIWSSIPDPRVETTALPVGTGPYRLVDHQAGSSYRLEANPAYFNGAPLVDAIELSILPDDQAAFAALEANAVDMVARSTPLDWIERLDLLPDVEMLVGGRQQSVHLQFNLGNEILRNGDVRRGLGLAIDVDTVLDVVEEGAGRLGNDTWTHPNSIWTRDPLGSHLSDVAAADQLLRAAGFTDAGDGTLLGPTGQPAAFTIGYDAARPRHGTAAQSVADQLAAIGVAISLQPLDSAALPPTTGGTGTLPPTDLVIGELDTHHHDDPDHLYFLFHSTSAATDLFGGYTNPELDAAITQLMFEPQESEVRTQALITAQDILAADLPLLTLYYPAWRMAYRPAVYDGWQAEETNGFLTKRSLLPTFADQGQGERTVPPPSVPAFEGFDEDGASEDGGFPLAAAIALGVAGIAAIGAFGPALRTRLTADPDDRDDLDEGYDEYDGDHDHDAERSGLDGRYAPDDRYEWTERR